MTEAQAFEHQRKHGFLVKSSEVKTIKSEKTDRALMNSTETEYSFILEAMKRRGEIVEWRFEGISLAWGLDPDTQKPMRYKPDFYVVTAFDQRLAENHPSGVGRDLRDGWLRVTLIEVKGPHIESRDIVRFKGCRSDWPMFLFEMWQRQKGGSWQRIH